MAATRCSIVCGVSGWVRDGVAILDRWELVGVGVCNELGLSSVTTRRLMDRGAFWEIRDRAGGAR